MSCLELTQQNPLIGYAYSRQIDSLIHSNIPYSTDIDVIPDFEVKMAIAYPDFIQHQQTILEAVDGCEKEVFNDPNGPYNGAYYIGKPQIYGKEGHMSTIMTNGFLHLYNSIIDKVPDISLHADIDLKILLNLVESVPIVNGKIQIPEDEVKIIHQICQKLYPKRQTNIFTPEWYSGLEEFITNIDALIRQKYPYRYGFPGNPAQGEPAFISYGLDVGVGYLRPRPRPQAGEQQDEPAVKENANIDLIRYLYDEAEEKGWLFNRDYRLYETHPPYAVMDPDTNQFIRQTKDVLIKSVIPQLKTIFPPTPLARRGGKRSKRSTRSIKKRGRRTRRH